jgi:hypothetical protein
MDLDHFHFLNKVELLSVAEFKAIGRVVWPEDEEVLSGY